MTDNDYSIVPLPKELRLLEEVINALPCECRDALREPLEDHKDKVRRQRVVLAAIQETMNQLRVDVKYLLFDLDATRRERDELRERLG